MTAQSHVIRAAVVQAAPIAFDRERTLAKVRALTGEAASQGAQLVVFPEAFVSCRRDGTTSEHMPSRARGRCRTRGAIERPENQSKGDHH